MKRLKSRDSLSTPLSVAPSPGSMSALSSTPSSGGSSHTPPGVMNGQHPSLPAALPFMGALGPAGFLPHHLLYPQLLGLPGGIPPGLLIPSPHTPSGGGGGGLVSPAEAAVVGGRARVAATPESPPASSSSSRGGGGGTTGSHPAHHTSAVPGSTTPRSTAGALPPSNNPPGPPTSTGPPPPPPQPHTAFPGPRLGPLPPGGGYLPSFPFGPFPPPGPGIPPAGILPPPSVAAANGLLPPATLMVPYPVPIPLPLPIPIVLPVKTDKDVSTILNMYNKKTSPQGVSTNSSSNANSAASSSVHHHQRDVTPARVIDIKPIKTESAINTAGGNDASAESSSYASPSSRSAASPRDAGIKCACCQTGSPLDGSTNGHCSAQAHCRADGYRSKTINTCSGAPIAVTSTSDLEDGVIDLSTDRQSRDEDDSSPSSGSHIHGRLPIPPPDGDVDQNKNSLCIKPPSGGSSNGGADDSRCPSIGVATSSSAAPVPAGLPLMPSLVAPFVALAPSPLLPLPPQESAYSARRGRILDAPSVPRDRNRSPTPERRVMVRGPSREVLFAKRRIMRARIKTK